MYIYANKLFIPHVKEQKHLSFQKAILNCNMTSSTPEVFLGL